MKNNTRDTYEKLLHHSVLSLVGEFPEKIDDRCCFADRYGYKYESSLRQVYNGMRLKGNRYIPSEPISSRNPYTRHNLRIYFSSVSKPFIFNDELSEYINSESPTLFFTCSMCNNIWNTSWNSVYTMNTGCSYCNGKRTDPSKSLEHHPLIKEWDYDKNLISPSSILPKSGKIVWWKCSDCGFSWKTSPAQRTVRRKTNCPSCNSNSSKGANYLEKLLLELGIPYDTEKRFEDCRYKNPLPFDFYLPYHNACIEYQGQHHYIPVDYGGRGRKISEKEFLIWKIKDSIKVKYCLEKGINLLRVSYKDSDDVKNILIRFMEEITNGT